MANAGVNIVQQFTTDHELAVKAIRLPRGIFSSMDSSLPIVDKPRKRLASAKHPPSGSDGHRWYRPASRRDAHVLATWTTVRRRTAGTTRLSQHANHSVDVILRTWNQPALQHHRQQHLLAGHRQGGTRRLGFDLGLSGLSKIADETGGECYSLGTSPLVSFKPYLDRLQKNLNNEYYLALSRDPKNKPGLQRVSIRTQKSNSEIAAPNNVWVPAAGAK